MPSRGVLVVLAVLLVLCAPSGAEALTANPPNEGTSHPGKSYLECSRAVGEPSFTTAGTSITLAECALWYEPNPSPVDWGGSFSGLDVDPAVVAAIQVVAAVVGGYLAYRLLRRLVRA